MVEEKKKKREPEVKKTDEKMMRKKWVEIEVSVSENDDDEF